MKMDDATRDVLKSAVVVGSWHVTADTLVPIGRLIAGGYLTASDDYEGPRLHPTDKARKMALKLKLAEYNEERGEYTHAHTT